MEYVDGREPAYRGGMDGDLSITAYVNVLDPNYYSYAFPRFIQRNRRIFERYERFKPETKLKVVYYYDTITEIDGGVFCSRRTRGKVHGKWQKKCVKIMIWIVPV